jgi:SPP1 gp7 family putative phage head morphogenesis protein
MPSRRKRESPFEKARSLEEGYAVDLRKIAREVGRIIDSYPPGDPFSVPLINEALRRYTEILDPWAKARADLIVQQINHQDARAWQQATAEMSTALRRQVYHTPVGALMYDLRVEQIGLIKSLPLEAGARVQRLSEEAIVSGTRSKDFIEEIMRSGEVSRARATTIARTEVSRMASTLTESRARHIESEGYIWRTSRDADVRPSHRAMEGKYVPWNKPPTTDGLVGHAGCVPNCRCYPEPLIPDRLENN